MAIIRKLLPGNLTELVQIELCSLIAPCPLGQNCPRKIAKSMSMSLSRSMSRFRSRSRSRSKSMSMSWSESWSESRSRWQSRSIILTTTKISYKSGKSQDNKDNLVLNKTLSRCFQSHFWDSEKEDYRENYEDKQTRVWQKREANKPVGSCLVHKCLETLLWELSWSVLSTWKEIKKTITEDVSKMFWYIVRFS